MTVLNTAMHLPLHLDEVTPQWLTEVMQQTYPGVKISAAAQDAERFGTAASARFRLTYADRAGHDLPPTLYVKGGFDDKWRKRTWVVLQTEARFYAELAPEITLNIPKAYYSAINDAPQGIIVIEDLGARGVRFGHDLNPVTADGVASILEAVSGMHAQWWESPRLPDYVAWREPQREFLKYLYRPKHWAELLEWKHGDLLEQVLGNPETAVRSLEALWAIMDVKPRTFVHGDLHGGNIFYEADGRPGFLDWQLCFSGDFMHDVAWIIVTAFTVEQRRAHETDMIKTYLAALKARGGPAPAFDAAWLSYRQNMAHAMSSYGAVPRDNGPKHVLEGAAERVFTAATDLELLQSLGICKS